MTLQICTIRDTKADYYSAPNFFRSLVDAERNLLDLLSNPQHQVAKNPEDYDLYSLGTYDDATGVINQHKSPQHITKAIHLKKSIN